MESMISKQNNLKSALYDIVVMAKRNILKIKHNPDKLIDVTVIPIFFMIVFSYLFGGAIAGGVQGYLPIIVPGILIQTLVMSSSATGTQLREDLDTGVFDRFKSLPIVRIAPLAGLVASDILRYVAAAFFSIGTGFFLDRYGLYSWMASGSRVWVVDRRFAFGHIRRMRNQLGICIDWSAIQIRINDL